MQSGSMVAEEAFPAAAPQLRHHTAASAHATAEQALLGLHAHEQVCAERYAGILSRIGRLEAIIIGSAGSLIFGMAGIIATLALRAH